MAAWTIGLDLGASRVRMATRKGGIIFNESALGVISAGKGTECILGDQAYMTRGRERPGQRTGTAMESGRMANEKLLNEWIAFLLTRSRGPVLYVGGPNAREADLQAVRHAVEKNSGSETSVLEAELASAAGAWFPGDGDGALLDIWEKKAMMIVEIGASGAFAAVLSDGRIIERESMAWGLSESINALRREICAEYQLSVGENSTEEIFRAIAARDVGRSIEPLDIYGLHLGTLLPAKHIVAPELVWEALKPCTDAVCRIAENVLQRVSPAVASDLYERGGTITGGGGYIPAFRQTLQEHTGLSFKISDEPDLASIRGTLRIMNAPERLGSLVLQAD